jgi:hypothetical protein
MLGTESRTKKQTVVFLDRIAIRALMFNPILYCWEPEKTEMILLTDRPPQLETPLHYFRQDLTPMDTVRRGVVTVAPFGGVVRE